MDRMSLLFCLLVGLAPAAAAQSSGVEGTWKTPGGAVIQVAPCGADLCATILQLEPHPPVRVDANNPDPAKRTSQLCGLRIGYSFHRTDPDHAEDGHLYDPKTGKTYKGSMESQGNTLNLRGYVGIKAFGRSERWSRTLDAVPPCSAQH